jgi:predicted transposase YbfD/YdcC
MYLPTSPSRKVHSYSTGLTPNRTTTRGSGFASPIETRPAPAALTNAFPGAEQFIRCIRTVVRKDTGEIRFQETEYAITSCLASAEVLYKHWRGHWQIENRLHHKRDTVWREIAASLEAGLVTLCWMFAVPARARKLSLLYVTSC